MMRLQLPLSAIGLAAVISFTFAVAASDGEGTTEGAAPTPFVDADTRGLDAVVLEVGATDRTPGRILVREGEMGCYGTKDGGGGERTLGIAVESIGDRGSSVRLGLYEVGDARDVTPSSGRRLETLELTLDEPAADSTRAAEHLGLTGVRIALQDVRLVSR